MERKRTTRIISGIVSLGMVLSYGGVMPYADSAVFNQQDSVVHAAGVTYSISGDTMKISGEGVITKDIKKAVDGSITKIIIDEGIVSLGSESFSGLTGLKSVVLPSTLITIGSFAFNKCSNLESVSISNGTEKIGNYAFSLCYSLKGVTFPESVKSVGSFAFQNCTALESVNFEGDIFRISFGASAFSAAGTDGKVIHQGNRVLASNESDSEVISILKALKMSDSWFVKIIPDKSRFTVKLPEGRELLFDGKPKSVSVELIDGNPECGTVTVAYKDVSGSLVDAPVAKGKYTVYFSVAENDNYSAATIEAGTFEIVDEIFTVSTASCINGTVQVNKTKCGKGETVTVTVQPAAGYFVSSVSFNDTEISAAEGIYSFVMPEENVTVKAVFAESSHTEAVPATCTEPGTKEFWTLNGVNYSDAACKNEITDFDSWILVPAKGHSYGQWTVTEEAGCTEAGSKVRVCKECDDVDTAAVSAKGHSFGEWTLTKEATETEPGTETRKCSSCDAEETRETALKEHEHVAGEPVITPATCTKDGSKVVKCVSCGETLSNEKIAKTGHTEGEWSVKKAATCTLEGIKELKCAVCAAVINTETIPAAGHKWNAEATTDKNATCTEDGSKSVHCSVCDAVTGVEAIPATGHKAGEFEVKTAATCTSDGEAVQKCTVCKDVVDTKKIEATGHKAGEFEVKKAATCTSDGEKIQKCTSCGEVLASEKIAKTGHSFGEWKVVKEPTETETGLKERTCTACKETEKQEMAVLVHTHTPGAFEVKTAATCTADGEEVQKCTSCGEVLDVKKMEAAGHKAGEFEVKTAATCETDGVNVQKCTVCGEVLETETVSKTGHRFGEWTVTAEPTETEAGVKTRVCDVCKKTETETVAALGHTHKPGAYETVPATCTADGKSVQKCLGCGEVLDEKVIKSEGHKWNSEAAVDKAATCTEDGSKSVHCSVCGETKDNEVIPATGHKAGEFEVKTATTCTSDGEEVQKCTVCGEILDTRKTAATGHSFGEWKADKLPTLTEAGTEVRKCDKCETEETRPFPPITIVVPEEIIVEEIIDETPEIVKPVVEHKYGDWTVTKEPTWSNQGVQSRVCADCNDVQTRPYGEAGITTVKKAVVKVIRKLKSFFR